ncbi:hypothetical protein HYQ46_008439 [Verticillium longisporum]|nr:hypothetical protein HYQ46_008439 [Verticillium longisporum]
MGEGRCSKSSQGERTPEQSLNYEGSEEEFQGRRSPVGRRESRNERFGFLNIGSSRGLPRAVEGLKFCRHWHNKCRFLRENKIAQVR